MGKYLKDLKIPFFTIFFIFLGLIIYIKIAGPIQLSGNFIEIPQSNIFQVQGNGQVTAAPNMVIASFGITNQGSNIATLQNQANETINKIANDLQAMGIGKQNIQTTNYEINPSYDNNQKITGYTINQTIQVSITPINKINQAIDKAVSDGANIVGNLQFTFNDQTNRQLENQALQKAVDNAKNKALALSKASGIHLGRLINVQQQNPSVPEIQSVLMAKTAGSLTNVNPGENTLEVNVTLSYQID